MKNNEKKTRKKKLNGQTHNKTDLVIPLWNRKIFSNLFDW